MKRKILAVIVATESLILLVLLFNSLGWLNFLPKFELLGCGGEIYATAQSPDKTLTAYAFQRDCGATTGFTTLAILRSSDDKLDLTKDLETEEIIFSADGDYHPRLNWVSKGDLRITFVLTNSPSNKDIYSQTVKQWDTTIEYSGLK